MYRIVRHQRGSVGIGALLTVVFLIISSLAALAIFGVYQHQRDLVVRQLGRAEAQRMALLISDQLYSVMRKGWTRAEMEDVIHHVRLRLPDYEVGVIRSEAVAKQFGDISGHAQQRRTDALVAQVLIDKKDVFEVTAGILRFGFPVIMATECLGCYSLASPGDVNGVITVGIPAEILMAPIESVVLPATQLLSGLILVLFAAVFLVLRWKVVQPIADFAVHVKNAMKLGDDARQIAAKASWTRELASLADGFNALMSEVTHSHAQLTMLSVHDALTGLHNRRHFDSCLKRALSDSKAGATAFGLLMMDLNHFKPVNDRYGHATGDALLVEVARTILSTVRAHDIAARIGGDEFVVLALGTHQELIELAERLSRAVASVSVRAEHSVVYASCSIGVASYPQDGDNATDLLKAADSSMYVNKREGKAAAAHTGSG
jgi:diguanylate cyclase (GGDEF)-like protein